MNLPQENLSLNGQKNVKILVLLATYNGGAWLNVQLESILSQLHVDVQVLIGDDISNDETIAMLSKYWGNESRISVRVSNKNSGSAGANFRRLFLETDLSGIDYVALADQDDIWMHDKLISAVRMLRKTKSSGYSCAVQAFWPDGREKLLAQNAKIRRSDYLFEGAGQGCTFVISVDFFQRVQAFCRDSSDIVSLLHYHDWLLYLLSRAWGLQWFFDSTPHMRYRQHDGNEIGARGGFSAIIRRFSKIKNGWYVRQIQAAINIYKIAGGRDATTLEIDELIKSSPSFLRSIKLAKLFFRHGRRRIADRCVLVGAVLTGYL